MCFQYVVSQLFKNQGSFLELHCSVFVLFLYFDFILSTLLCKYAGSFLLVVCICHFLSIHPFMPLFGQFVLVLFLGYFSCLTFVLLFLILRFSNSFSSLNFFIIFLLRCNSYTIKHVKLQEFSAFSILTWLYNKDHDLILICVHQAKEKPVYPLAVISIPPTLTISNYESSCLSGFA